jgi:hypothetical protein
MSWAEYGTSTERLISNHDPSAEQARKKCTAPADVARRAEADAELTTTRSRRRARAR